MMKKKLHFAFKNKPLTYLSTEGETEVEKIRLEELAAEKKAGKKKGKGNSIDSGNKTNGNNRSNTDNKEDFETAKKGMVKVLIFLIAAVFSFIGFAVWYKYFR